MHVHIQHKGMLQVYFRTLTGSVYGCECTMQLSAGVLSYVSQLTKI